MKLFKMLSLAIISATAAMAFVGVSAASADTFCLSAAYESTCAVGNRAPAGTELAGELKEGKLVMTGALNIECTNSTLSGKLTTNSAPTIAGKATGVTITGCTNCTEVTAKEFASESQWIIVDDWLSFGGGVQLTTITIFHPVVDMQKCPLGIQCTATAEKLVLDGSSTGAAGTLKAVNEPMSLGVCGNGTLNATYKLTKPLPSWVSQNP